MYTIALWLRRRDGVDELADTENYQIGDQLTKLGKRHQREAEPQTENSAEIRYVLNRLQTLY